MEGPGQVPAQCHGHPKQPPHSEVIMGPHILHRHALLPQASVKRMPETKVMVLSDSRLPSSVPIDYRHMLVELVFVTDPRLALFVNLPFI